MSRARAFFSKLLIGLSIAAAMLASLETGLRLVWHYAGAEAVTTSLSNRNDPSAKQMVIPSAVVEQMGNTLAYGIQSNVLTSPDSHLLFRVRPNPTGAPVFCYEGIDDHGFRTRGSLDALRERKNQGSIRILLLGDSCGFGWEICRFDRTIGSWTQALLEEVEGTGKAEVVNLSQPGYSTAQAVLLFREWFPRVRPDFVVLYFGWNDRWPSRGLTDAQLLRLMPILGSPRVQALTNTALYRTMVWLVAHSVRTSPGPNAPAQNSDRIRVPVAESLANYRTMIEAAKASNAKVIIVTPPYDPEFHHRDLQIDVFNHAIEEAFRSDALFVPLPAMRPGSPDAANYFVRDGYHPNERGARYIADSIVAAIRSQRPG